MGGSEMGGGESLEGIQAVMMINREVALECATERAERTRLAFRRTKVFERTFERVLKYINEMVGVEWVVDRYAPEGYADPYAVIETTAVDTEN